MSCDVAAAAFLLFTAAQPHAGPVLTPAVAIPAFAVDRLSPRE